MASKSEVLLMALAHKRGMIEGKQVQLCMDEQKKLAAKGQDARLEDLVIAKGYLTPPQIKELREASGSSAPKPVTVEDASRIPIYEIHEQIGTGGMATVFYGIHKESGEPRAIKILYKEHNSNQLFVQRFLREGKLLKEFNHPNIAQGYEYGTVGRKQGDPLYFMGMEYIEGESLQEMLDRDGPFSEQKAIHSITEASKGLAYMQGEGVVHRDIKPENIMWATDGRILLVDLGFAKSISGSGDGEYEDETCGTVQYISPEQAKGKADLDIRADIYSLGATLYHLIIGKLPFSGKDSMEVMAAQVMNSLDTAQTKSGKMSMHMHYFIEKMMAKDRDIRYQSAAEIVEDIAQVLAGAADLVYDASESEAASPFANLSNAARRVGAAPSPRSGARAPGGAPRPAARTPQAGGAPTPRRPAGGQQQGSGGGNQNVRLPSKRNVRMPGAGGQAPAQAPSQGAPAPRRNQGASDTARGSNPPVRPPAAPARRKGPPPPPPPKR